MITSWMREYSGEMHDILVRIVANVIHIKKFRMQIFLIVIFANIGQFSEMKCSFNASKVCLENRSAGKLMSIAVMMFAINGLIFLN